MSVSREQVAANAGKVCVVCNEAASDEKGIVAECSCGIRQHGACFSKDCKNARDGGDNGVPVHRYGSLVGWVIPA